MTLEDLARNLREVSSTSAGSGGQDIYFALMKYLKDNKEVILNMNKDQLFEEHIGADGRPTGHYALTKFNEELGRDGQPFTMVDTGLFREGMYIEFYYRHITIRSKYHTYEMLQNPHFNTYEWFGLTEANFERLVQEYVKPFLKEWLLNKLLQSS